MLHSALSSDLFGSFVDSPFGSLLLPEKESKTFKFNLLLVKESGPILIQLGSDRKIIEDL